MDIEDYKSFCSINEIDYGDNILVFLFGGNWCTPCKNLYNSLQTIDNCLIYKINVEKLEFEDYISDNNITSIPYSIVKYKNNMITFKGERTRSELLEMFASLKIETITEK